MGIRINRLIINYHYQMEKVLFRCQDFSKFILLVGRGESRIEKNWPCTYPTA